MLLLLPILCTNNFYVPTIRIPRQTRHRVFLLLLLLLMSHPLQLLLLPSAAAVSSRIDAAPVAVCNRWDSVSTPNSNGSTM
jgi:hypothetical protein